MRWSPAARWRKRRPRPVTYADDGTLGVVGGSFDPARADSEVIAAIEASGVDLGRPMLVRHHLRLPDEPAVSEARRLLAGDGYTLVAVPVAGEASPVDEGHGWSARASRTQPLTGLAAAQERSRMAGLAQRLGGEATGWDACAPVRPQPDPDR